MYSKYKRSTRSTIMRLYILWVGSNKC